jgi:hypothetical protein
MPAFKTHLFILESAPSHRAHSYARVYLQKIVWPKINENNVNYLLVKFLNAFKIRLTAVGSAKAFSVGMLPNCDRGIYMQAWVHPECVSPSTQHTHYKGQRAHFMKVKTNFFFIFSVCLMSRTLVNIFSSTDAVLAFQISTLPHICPQALLHFWNPISFRNRELLCSSLPV